MGVIESGFNYMVGIQYWKVMSPLRRGSLVRNGLNGVYAVEIQIN